MAWIARDKSIIKYINKNVVHEASTSDYSIVERYNSMYYLYIKTHNITGLKYLGQTQKNPFEYTGSGKRWKRHLNKHGNDVSTEILLETNSFEELKEKGMYYSKKFNVVDDATWANLTEETGNGMSSRFSSELQKQRIKEGTLPQMFTAKKTREFNLQRVQNGTHPFVGGKITKKNNKKMLKAGTHPFTDPAKRINNSKRVSETQAKLSNLGLHNFKNKIPVVDINGKNCIISKEEYYNQKVGDPKTWKYVSTASKEAKRRKNETNF